MIFTAQPETLDVLWQLARPHLDKFSDVAVQIDPDEIYEQLKKNEQQLWLFEHEGIINLVVITEVRPTPNGRICTIKIASGNPGKQPLLDIFAEIEKWAIDSECTGIEIIGRKGWARLLDGFKQKWVILEKDLRQVQSWQ